MDPLDERDKVQSILGKANPVLRKHLAPTTELFLKLEPAVISRAERSEIEAIKIGPEKIDRLLEIIKFTPAEVYFTFMGVLKKQDIQLYAAVESIQNDEGLQAKATGVDLFEKQKQPEKRPFTSTSNGHGGKRRLTEDDLEEWKQVEEFSTIPELPYPLSIALLNNENVALTNPFGQAMLFSNDGENMRYIHDIPPPSYTTSFDHTSLSSISVIRNQFVLPGQGKFLYYTETGEFLQNKFGTTHSSDGDEADPMTLAVDYTMGRIITGLTGNTISIHHADGRLIKKWSTGEKMAYSLDVTSNKEIAVTFDDHTLHIMNDSGHDDREVPRPEGVNRWIPKAVCCSKQGEIFVVNDGDKSVYRYTADGRCHGRIISGLNSPMGIALTKDEQQVYVVEQNLSLVKKFKRPLSANSDSSF